MMEVNCPHCGARQPVSREKLGTEVFCESCGGKFRIAGEEAPAGGGGFRWEGRPMHRNWLGQWVLGILLAPVIVGLFLILDCLIRRWSRHYTINPSHIISKEGIFTVHTTQIAVKDIRSIDIRASFIQRLLGIRSVYIGTSGPDGVEMSLLGLPAGVAAEIQKLQAR